jgi:hypothetical protein
VILHRSWADEQAGANLGIRQPVPGEPRDPRLLDRELAAHRGGAPADGVHGDRLPGTAGVGLGANRGEHVTRGAQLPLRVRASVRATQPFAVEEMRARQRQTHPGAAGPLDRLT